MFTGLNYARIEAAALGIGILRGVLRLTTSYARERLAFERPIAEHQLVQAHLGRMATDLAAARGLQREAADRFSRNDPNHMPCSMAKLFASDAAMRAATNAITIFGGYGVSNEYEIERFFRDAKATQIFDGTSDVLTLMIGRDAAAQTNW
jgi:alkylation response protein AidB-like acyl-CoA dehydrogenase